MIRITRVLPTLLVVGSALTAACKKEAPAPAPPPPAPVAAPVGLVITEVKVGSDVNAQHRVEAGMERISLRDDFHVSVITDGKGTDVPVIATWMNPAGAVLKVDTTHVSADGPEATRLKLTRTNTWAPGKYKVQVKVGDAPARTVEFTVGT